MAKRNFKPKSKLTPARMVELEEAYAQYIERTPDPHQAGFLSSDPLPRKYWVTKDDLYNWPEMRRYNQLAALKSEAFLLADGRSSQHTTFSIFRLKQPNFGYKDRVEQELTAKGEPIVFINAVPRPKLTSGDKLQRKAISKKHKD